MLYTIYPFIVNHLGSQPTTPHFMYTEIHPPTYTPLTSSPYILLHQSIKLSRGHTAHRCLTPCLLLKPLAKHVFLMHALIHHTSSHQLATPYLHKTPHNASLFISSYMFPKPSNPPRAPFWYTCISQRLAWREKNLIFRIMKVALHFLNFVLYIVPFSCHFNQNNNTLPDTLNRLIPCRFSKVLLLYSLCREKHSIIPIIRHRCHIYIHYKVTCSLCKPSAYFILVVPSSISSHYFSCAPTWIAFFSIPDLSIPHSTVIS